MSLNDSDCLVLCRYLDGGLQPQELEQLKAKLQQDPSLRKYLAELVYQRQWLMEMKDESHAAKILESASPKLIERKSYRRTPWFALAASLTLALGVWMWVMVNSQRGDLARVLEVRGEVLVAEGGKVTQGQEIAAGSEIRTGNDGRIKLAFGKDVIEIVLNKNSRLRTVRSKVEKTLYLDIGQLTAIVARQPKNKSLVIRTPHATASVVGTELSLEVLTERTKLKVDEGKVLLTRLADGASVDVESGQFASVAPGMEMIARSSNLDVEPHVFLQDFNGVSQGQQVIDRIVLLNENGQETSALTSMGITSGSTSWQPNVFVGIRSSNANSLFKTPVGMEIRLRIKSEQTGDCNICLEPTVSTSKEQAFNTDLINIGPEWKILTLRVADFIPYRRPHVFTPDLTPNFEISGIVVYGFGVGNIFVDRIEVLSSNPAEESTQ
jgi:hypothetical protein